MKERAYYDVVLVTTKGRQTAAGRWIRNKREAEWLAATIKRKSSGYWAGGARFPQATILDMFLGEACTLMKYLPDRGIVTASSAVASARPSPFTFSGG